MPLGREKYSGFDRFEITSLIFVAAALTAAPFAALGQGVYPIVSAHYVEREFYLPDATAGPRGLDVLEVRVAGEGRKPVAILTHGSSFDARVRRTLTPWSLLDEALWFAQRGYIALVVVRQGFGRSGGLMAGGGCQGGRDGFATEGEASADDLRVAIRFMAKRSDVNSNQIISVGVSTGGFAAVALSAKPPKGLQAVINFSGGAGADGRGHNCNLEGVVNAFRSFGKRARISTLWLYAENDHWFEPAVAERFEASYKAGGGQVDFHILPGSGKDGQTLFRQIDQWSDIVDRYLRDLSLMPLAVPIPLPDVQDIPFPDGLDKSGQGAFKHYLQSGPYKAFAMDGTHHWGWAGGSFSQVLADNAAVSRCRKADPRPRSTDLLPAGERCMVVQRTGDVPKGTSN